MRTMATLAILVLGLFIPPAFGADFYCPLPAPLPQTLNLAPSQHGSQPHKLQQLQANLNNLMKIRDGYLSARSNGARNTIANCLLQHLVIMADNHSLLSPQTRADGATWFLFAEEVRHALNTIQPRHLRNKPEVRFIEGWLSTVPAYGPKTPFAISSR